ncbi:DIL domain-containing protein [Diplocarpon rosae]|nr:DIL domain-containing protein [Diplocarpon rosae]
MASTSPTTASSPRATTLTLVTSATSIRQLQLNAPTCLDEGIVGLRYEETIAGKPPIAVTIAPPRAPPIEPHPALRQAQSSADITEEWKRDSGLAPTTSSKAREGSVNTADAIEEEQILGIEIDFDANQMLSAPLQSPTFSIPESKATNKSVSIGTNGLRWKPAPRKGSNTRLSTAEKTPEEMEFPPTITTPIHTEELIDEDFLKTLSFSKRGSVMLGGKKAITGQGHGNVGRSRQKYFSVWNSPTTNILTDDIEKESQKVRSMYEQGSNLDWEAGANSGLSECLDTEQALREAGRPETTDLLGPNSNIASFRPGSTMSLRQEHELAGGIEDWEDVDGNDVDRYGFIDTRHKISRPGTPEPRPPQRVSTVLQLASEAPRRRRIFGRSASSSASNAASKASSKKRAPSRKVSARSLRTVSSASSRRSTSRMRSATNHLPGNKDRRLMDEAGDMLTLPPGLADIAEHEEGGKAAEFMKQKEWERTEKWRKMAKIVKIGKDGQGMAFEFDASSPKLIERTWKGIPDRWRAAAWHSFLSSSAKKRKDSATDEQIIRAFHTLLDQSSADDVQIDLDVPRTINSHIMFRRRYRGGQRLLFRVLHCLSLYFPDTGYVQGMACLAATLLCYYDEEMAFVMLARMWTLRGLDKLYETGFPGLMAALDEFHKKWLSSGPVAAKLDEMSIEPTAYGTRWYLTLFNYSIPFPAQLRVWDVFMLLGDPDPSCLPTPDRPFAGNLDIIHATSAALIDGTRDILLDSDFESAMKILTSWIPVKDEELLMRVTRAEWKLHRGRKK